MRNYTIKQRLISMTVILALLITGLSVIFFIGFGNMADTYQKIPNIYVPQQQVSSAMVQVLLKEEMIVSKINEIKNDYDHFEGLVAESENNITQYKKLNDALLNGSTDLGTVVTEFKGIIVEKATSDEAMESLILKANKAFISFITSHNNFIEKKRKYLQSKKDLGWYSDDGGKGIVKKLVTFRDKLKSYIISTTQRLFVDELAENEKAVLDNYTESAVKRYKEMMSETNTSVYMFAVDASLTDEVKGVLSEYTKAGNSAIELLGGMGKIESEISEILNNEVAPKVAVLNAAVSKIKNQANEQIMNATQEAANMRKSSKTMIFLISMFVIGVGLVFGWFVSLKINRTLSIIIEGLGESSEQVASASAQVSASSQSMSEGSSQQAASIEETSSSLEEMSSMTKQNAEHANQADNLMKDANQIVNQANTSMSNLTGSMAEISNASDETSKIIKEIDEISFQTNLLALNAAVEAARAGEAGAGFAVVADEVRNLAMRAAEAAKNTSMLIEGTVKKIKEGSNLVKNTNQAFVQVSESSSKVGALVAEIAAASKEQAQGIIQVNNAVTEMDKVVQQNAATAEETASASEEMSAQAQQMQYIVKEMIALVGGAGSDNIVKSRFERDGNHKPDKKDQVDTTKTMNFQKESDKKQDENVAVLSYPGCEINPEEVIPLDDNELNDF